MNSLGRRKRAREFGKFAKVETRFGIRGSRPVQVEDGPNALMSAPLATAHAVHRLT